MKIRIKNLKAHTVLGVYEWEQQQPRPVILNLCLTLAEPAASSPDALHETVDYAMIEQKIIALLEKSRFQLIETMVARLAEHILSLDARILALEIEADKPGALAHSESVSVSRVFSRG